jgi:DNA polymerase
MGNDKGGMKLTTTTIPWTNETYVANLLSNFQDRLIKTGYPQTSVVPAIAKVGALMYSAMLNDQLCFAGLPDQSGLGRASCKLCSIGNELGCRAVPGNGDPRSPVMFIGESPGEHESIFGIPFIGIAGVALTIWLEKMPLKREQVYLTNVLKHRPAGNRTPTPVEAEPCINNHLLKEILIMKPLVIVAVGGVAFKALFPRIPQTISQVRGTWLEFNHAGLKIPTIPIFHPAYVIRKTGTEFITLNHTVFADLTEAFSKI